MKSISVVLTGLLFAAMASVAYSQSLADLAKKEKERRQATKTDAKVIKNEPAPKAPAGPDTEVVVPASGTEDKAGAPNAAPGAEKPAGEGEQKGEAAGAQKEKPASDEPVDFFGRPESFWRQAFAEARLKVKSLENESNVIILKLNDLHNQFYRESDGFKQQTIQREIQKTFYEQDLNKKNLAKAKADLDDLEREARKSGALPGWIREPSK